MASMKPTPRRPWPPVAQTAAAIIATASLALLAAACSGSPPSAGSSGSSSGSANARLVAYSQCMRSHGVPNLPDPIISDGRVVIVFSLSRDGIDPHSPQILAKAHECQHVLPPGSPLPHATVAP
jgi:hypothetical protein